MENKDKSILYGYILIEFTLFIVSYIFTVNMGMTFKYPYFTLAGFLLNIVFLIIYRMREKKDRPFAILFSTLIFIAEIIGAFGLAKVSYLLFFLAVFGYLLWHILQLEKKKMILLIVSSIIAAVLISLLFLNVLEGSVILLISTALAAAPSIILMVYKYNNQNMLHKPNWFFGIMGLLVYCLYLVCMAFGPLMSDSALMKQMVVMGSKVLLIPSIMMISVSFIFFQPREA